MPADLIVACFAGLFKIKNNSAFQIFVSWGLAWAEVGIYHIAAIAVSPLSIHITLQSVSSTFCILYDTCFEQTDRIDLLAYIWTDITA